MPAFLRKNWPHLLVLAVPFVFVAVFWPQLPARVATHFDAAGRPNGWMPRAPGVLLIPVVAVLVHALVRVWFRFDPKMRKGDAETRAQTESLILRGMLAVEVFLGACGMALVWTACHKDSAAVMAVIGYGMPLMFLVIGACLVKLKPNYVMGFRCGWTLESPVVWERTHRFSGRGLMILSVLLLALRAVPALKGIHVWLLLGCLAAWAVASYIYAFLAWRAESRVNGTAK